MDEILKLSQMDGGPVTEKEQLVSSLFSLRPVHMCMAVSKDVNKLQIFLLYILDSSTNYNLEHALLHCWAYTPTRC